MFEVESTYPLMCKKASLLCLCASLTHCGAHKGPRGACVVAACWAFPWVLIQAAWAGPGNLHCEWLAGFFNVPGEQFMKWD